MASKIGIITATYQRPHFVKKMIQQVLKLRASNFLFVLVHDGPGNETKQVFQKFFEGNSQFVFLETDKRVGDWGATPRLKGLEYLLSLETPPDYVVFWDDDNSFKMTSIASIQDELKRTLNPDLLLVPIYSMLTQVPTPGKSIGELTDLDLDTGTFVTKTELAFATYKFLLQESLGIGEDYKFFSKIRSTPDVKIAISNIDPIGRYDGLRFWASLRWKLGIPPLYIQRAKWYQTIRSFLRR